MPHTLGPCQMLCEVCYQNLVDSRKAETGKFYVVSGITLGASMDIKHICLAVCGDCSPLKVLRQKNPEKLVLVAGE
jgi:hypothetical protein